MNITKLKISNFRNVKNLEIEPDKGINIIYGENAQGKTNLIESIWLFSGFKSFRGAKDSEIIKFGEDFYKSELDFYASGREQNAKMIASPTQKRILLNSVPLVAASKMLGVFNCVVFAPSYLSLIKGNPSERRKFTDSALCRLKPQYAKTLSDYNKVLNQRNTLLKELKYSNKNKEFLEIWTSQLSVLSVSIVNERLNYIKQISDMSGNIYSGLSGKKEKLEIEYMLKTSSSRYEKITEPISFEFAENLFKQSESTDILYGTTNTGSHRDDIEIKIDGVSAKKYGSQGQQRSAALALKLGEAEIIKEITGERPVALLDDVMSELDINRQDYILNHIKDWQVFITCCEPSTVLRLYDGKTFEIRNGTIV